MGHFYTQQKGQTPINYQRQKNSAKTTLLDQLKLAWKKKLKDRWTKNAKKKKRMKLPARIVLHFADTTQIYTWDKWVLSARSIILPTWFSDGE